MNGPIKKDEGELQVTAQKGADAGRFADYLEAEVITPRADSIRNRVFAEIRDGKLTPEFAYQSWLSLYESHQIVRDLRKQQRAGARTAAMLEKLRAEDVTG